VTTPAPTQPTICVETERFEAGATVDLFCCTLFLKEESPLARTIDLASRFGTPPEPALVLSCPGLGRYLAPLDCSGVPARLVFTPGVSAAASARGPIETGPPRKPSLFCLYLFLSNVVPPLPGKALRRCAITLRTTRIPEIPEAPQGVEQNYRDAPQGVNFGPACRKPRGPRAKEHYRCSRVSEWRGFRFVVLRFEGFRVGVWVWRCGWCFFLASTEVRVEPPPR